MQLLWTTIDIWIFRSDNGERKLLVYLQNVLNSVTLLQQYGKIVSQEIYDIGYIVDIHVYKLFMFYQIPLRKTANI